MSTNNKIACIPREPLGSTNLITRIDSTDPAFTTANTFAYNGLGHRIRITDSTGTTHYVWDGIRITHEHDGSGSVSKRYTYGQSPIPGVSDLIDLHHLDGDTNPHYFYHFDRPGGVHRLTDAAEALAQAYEYSPFGRILADTGSAPNPFALPATWLRLSDRSGILSSPWRLYDAEVGRFVSRDPGARGGWTERYVYERTTPAADHRRRNMYQYANAAPLTAADPSGRQGFMFGPWSDHWDPPPPQPVTYDKDKYLGGHWTLVFGGYMKILDKVINAGDAGTISVRSRNLEGANDPTFEAAKCVLEAMGFSLPRTQNGVYWARFTGSVEGHTVNWSGAGGDRLTFSFVHVHHRGRERIDAGPFAFDDTVVTFYHEVNARNANANFDKDDDALRATVDTVIEAEMKRRRAAAVKPPPDKGCIWECKLPPNKGKKVATEYEDILCGCKVKY